MRREIKPLCHTCKRAIRRWFKHDDEATIRGWCGNETCEAGAVYGLLWVGHRQKSRKPAQAVQG